METASSNDNTQTIYLFTEISCGHSLLKVDISLPQNEEDCKVSTPEVIHHFYPLDRSPRRTSMGCGVFNSKLYILGGFISPLDPNYETQLPLDVMVFNPADASINYVIGGHLNFPKFDPKLFEADGKLFVLGSLLDRVDEPPDLNHLFEVYDPATKQWKILEPPPFFLKENITSYRWGFFWVVNSTKVIIQGLGKSKTLHTFNPKTYEWGSDYDFPTLKENFPFGSNSLQSLFDGHVYSPLGNGTFLKKGPILDPPQSTEQNLIMDWGGIDSSSFPKHWMAGCRAHSPVIIHLGDGRFCLIESGSFFDGYYDPPDGFDLVFDIYIHKLIQPDNKTLLRAKCLHAADFSLNTGRYCIGQCSSYHLISKT